MAQTTQCFVLPIVEKTFSNSFLDLNLTYLEIRGVTLFLFFIIIKNKDKENLYIYKIKIKKIFILKNKEKIKK